MREDTDKFILAALEASIYLRPREPGLTADEIREVAILAGFRRGQVDDALKGIFPRSVRVDGPRFSITPSPALSDFSFPSDFDPREPQAFQFVREHLKDLAAEHGRANARMDRNDLVAVGAAKGLSSHDIEVAITLLVLSDTLHAEGTKILHAQRNETYAMPLKQIEQARPLQQKMGFPRKRRLLEESHGLVREMLKKHAGQPGQQPAAEATISTSSGLSSRVGQALGHESLLALRTAVISARLTGSRAALLAHVPPEFVATLPVAPAPGEQVLMDLDALNTAGELTDGNVPLVIWLSNAVALAGGRQETKVFQEALDRARGDRPATQAAASTAPTSASAANSRLGAHPQIVHHHGDVHMGSTFTTTITGSTVGAIATGDGSVATGTVTVHQGPLTQAQHLEHIATAKKALADDETRLDASVVEALERFLKQARAVKVEARDLSELQREMHGILDQVWAEQTATALPKGLKVTEALAQSPAMAGVAKNLLGV